MRIPDPLPCRQAAAPGRCHDRIKQAAGEGLPGEQSKRDGSSVGLCRGRMIGDQYCPGRGCEAGGGVGVWAGPRGLEAKSGSAILAPVLARSQHMAQAPLRGESQPIPVRFIASTVHSCCSRHRHGDHSRADASPTVRRAGQLPSRHASSHDACPSLFLVVSAAHQAWPRAGSGPASRSVCLPAARSQPRLAAGLRHSI